MLLLFDDCSSSSNRPFIGGGGKAASFGRSVRGEDFESAGAAIDGTIGVIGVAGLGCEPFVLGCFSAWCER